MKEKRAALAMAVANKHLACVMILLIECDTDVNAVDQNGWSALFLAARKGHWDFVNTLIDWFANVNVCDQVRNLFLVNLDAH